METSQAVGQLAEALATAQGQFKPIKRESVNPFYKSKYADLSAIIDGTRDALAKNGLAITQTVSVNDHVTVETMLMHKSGEWIKGSIALKPKADDPQAAGSAITYGRRYSLGAILGVASEDDDDGNASAKSKPEAKPEERKPQTSQPDAPASTQQMNAIFAILTKIGVMDDFARHEKVSKILGLTDVMATMKGLTKAQASKVIEELGKQLS